MEGYIWLFIIGGFTCFFVGLHFWGKISELQMNSEKYIKFKPGLDNLSKAKQEYALKIIADKEKIQLREEEWNRKMKREKEEIDNIAKQKSMGFPWLAEAYANYFALEDKKLIEYLKTKKHPAHSAAKHVSIVKNEKRELVKANKIIDYKINYLEKLFPWISEFIAEDEDDEIPVRMDGDIIEDENKDAIKKYLTPEEYKSLPSVERNQMALDRYLESRNKSKWAIGRDYEMYTGYLYEQKGYKIEYKGIIDGFDDLGRDVIAIKDDEVCIIQCKRWAHYKEIHEKHIFQLFGTTMEYWIKNFKNSKTPKTFEEFAKILNENKLRPIFFTSTKLSDRAKEMAEALSIEVIENEPLGNFPRIKCNVNKDEFGTPTYIYHLPMDQQYDRTIITERSGDCSVFTVKEAEDKGFRRAFKHRFQG